MRRSAVLEWRCGPGTATAQWLPWTRLPDTSSTYVLAQLATVAAQLHDGTAAARTRSPARSWPTPPSRIDHLELDDANPLTGSVPRVLESAVVALGDQTDESLLGVPLAGARELRLELERCLRGSARLGHRHRASGSRWWTEPTRCAPGPWT